MVRKPLILSALAFNAAVFAGNEPTLDLLLQPWAGITQNDSWHGNGSYEIGFHRLKTSLLTEQSIGAIRAQGVLGVNLAENEFQNALENAYVSLSFKPYLQFRAGKFKTPFGANNLISDSRLPAIHRSFTNDHLQSALVVAGYRSGVQMSGSITDKVEFAIGTFIYPPNSLPGSGISDLYRLPVGRICFHPYPALDIEYMVSAPEMARVQGNGMNISKRLFLHDAAIHGHFAGWYQGFFELFIGVDTSDISKVQEIWTNYTDNIAYSLYTAHTAILHLPWNLQLKLTTAGEFINGLNYEFEHYIDRPFYYALTQDVKFELSDDVSTEFSYDTRIGRRFEPFRFQRLSAQINYSASMKMKSNSGERDQKGNIGVH
jgi:hypothetical protein